MLRGAARPLLSCIPTTFSSTRTPPSGSRRWASGRISPTPTWGSGRSLGRARRWSRWSTSASRRTPGCSGCWGSTPACRRFRPTRTGSRFLEHYAAASGRRLERLAGQTAEWFAGETRFFDVPRSRAWVLTRRIAHSAHHRGQLTAYLRMLGRDLYSTYGPTADTGGLFQQGAPVIYRYRPSTRCSRPSGRETARCRRCRGRAALRRPSGREPPPGDPIG